MFTGSALTCDLKANLRAVVSGSHTQQQLGHVVRVAHALSSAFLASKRGCGTLMNLHGLNLSDLAYDCIAELFQKSGSGEFIQLYAYFSGINLETSSDQEALAHFRRLVFSKVNHGVFRLYNEADPILSRILRNTKLAIASLGHFVELEQFGEQCIAPAMCDPLQHLPQLDREEIENQLMRASRGNESVPELLAKLAAFLRDQKSHCRILPIISTAYIFRTVYESKLHVGHLHAEQETSMLGDDVIRVVREVCRDVKNMFEKKYVGKKLQQEVFASYMQAIQNNLVERFIGRDGTETSLYDQLESIIRGLTKEDYRKYHRARLEYLSRQAHDLAVKRLRRRLVEN